jgi:hypothetical protein
VEGLAGEVIRAAHRLFRSILRVGFLVFALLALGVLLVVTVCVSPILAALAVRDRMRGL